jgi:hypothetical protein
MQLCFDFAENPQHRMQGIATLSPALGSSVTEILHDQ